MTGQEFLKLSPKFAEHSVFVNRCSVKLSDIQEAEPEILDAPYWYRIKDGKVIEGPSTLPWLILIIDGEIHYIPPEQQLQQPAQREDASESERAKERKQPAHSNSSNNKGPRIERGAKAFGIDNDTVDKDVNSIEAFLGECVVAAEVFTPMEEIYDAYMAYCQQNGYEPAGKNEKGTSTALGMALSKAGYKNDRQRVKHLGGEVKRGRWVKVFTNTAATKPDNDINASSQTEQPNYEGVNNSLEITGCSQIGKVASSPRENRNCEHLMGYVSLPKSVCERPVENRGPP